MSKKMKNIAQAEVLTLKEQISYQEGQVVSKDAGAKSGSKYYPVLIRKGRRDQHP